MIADIPSVIVAPLYCSPNPPDSSVPTYRDPSNNRKRHNYLYQQINTATIHHKKVLNILIDKTKPAGYYYPAGIN
jgi:hypothetical protein